MGKSGERGQTGRFLLVGTAQFVKQLEQAPLRYLTPQRGEGRPRHKEGPTLNSLSSRSLQKRATLTVGRRAKAQP
jgi:ribosomal protein L15